MGKSISQNGHLGWSACIEAGSPALVAPFLHAWVLALHEWVCTSQSTLVCNLRAFDLRYNVDWQNAVVPPWRLVSEWHDEGCPDPAAWIEKKLATVVHQQRTNDRVQ
jgi:hypothetical protein